MGINKIKCYGTYKGVLINRDYHVADDEQVFLGNGEGCHTFWFKNVEEAKRFIDHFEERIRPDERGLGLIPRELCLRCKCHYSFGSKEWREAEDYACHEYEERLKREVMES